MEVDGEAMEVDGEAMEVVMEAMVGAHGAGMETS